MGKHRATTTKSKATVKKKALPKKAKAKPARSVRRSKGDTKVTKIKGKKAPVEKKKKRFILRNSRRAHTEKAKATLTEWRSKFKGTGNSTFDDIQKASFLKLFALTGRFNHCAAAVDVTGNTVRRHLKEDKEFKEAYEDARGLYRDKVHEQAQKLAITGVDKPIIGGRFRDEIVAYETVYSSSILAMEMKRTNPEFKDSHKVDLGLQGGVMLIPSGMTLSQWEAKNSPKD